MSFLYKLNPVGGIQLWKQKTDWNSRQLKNQREECSRAAGDNISSLSDNQAVCTNSFSKETSLWFKITSLGKMPIWFCGFLCWTSSSTVKSKPGSFNHLQSHNWGLDYHSFTFSGIQCKSSKWTPDQMPLEFIRWGWGMGIRLIHFSEGLVSTCYVPGAEGDAADQGSMRQVVPHSRQSNLWQRQ